MFCKLTQIFHQINVTDVNDNPPFLAEPREVQVTENSEAQLVAQVKLGDPDDWRQGHGPPFTISLDPRAPTHVTDNIRVTLDKSESREQCKNQPHFFFQSNTTYASGRS